MVAEASSQLFIQLYLEFDMASDFVYYDFNVRATFGRR